MTAARDALLAELAARCGVEPHYYDISGQLQHTEPDTQEAILRAMGYRVETAADLERELDRQCRRPWEGLVEPVLALHQTQLPGVWNLYLPLSGQALPARLEVRWEVKDESGRLVHQEKAGPDLPLAETRSFGEAEYGRITLPLPWLELGYYDLQVRVETADWQRQDRSLLVVAPERVYRPEVLDRNRLWGFNLPLYALRSRNNWGIGDCGDLRRFLALGRQCRADIVGLNPLHHLGVHLEDSISPYYPASRCYANPLYLDLSAVPDLPDCPAAQEYLARPDIEARLRATRQNPQVQYQEVANLKSAVLKQLFAAHLENHGPPGAPRTARGRDFAAFWTREGETLQHFATFLALSEYWRAGGETYLTWQEWPAAYHDPDGPAVAAFTVSHQQEIFFQAYAQWLLARQLQETQDDARASGMALGLYLDLAVGVNPGGFDTWVHQDLFALGIDIGAPPDDFSPLGQNWCLAPLLPEQLRRQGYRYVIEMLRANCLPGGALRIDHVMGLFRLFWIPRGASARQGAYVNYPAHDLLKIVALESVRRQTAIIGEDLGTVAPYIREELQAYEVLSTRLFYFERDGNGACTPAAHYPERAVASITTHDLPTLAGFWQGRDIQVRQELQLFPGEDAVARAGTERHRAKEAILALLRDTGWLAADTAQALSGQAELPEEVKWGIIAHLAQTPCRLVLLSLEDIFGWLEQQNLPGTKDEYPNWRLKFPLALEDLSTSPILAQAARLMGQFRSRDVSQTKE